MFAYNEKKKTILDQGCHLNNCNRNSSHFIRLPGGSNPWKISVRMFPLANFQASFPSQVFFKNSEDDCSWQKVLEVNKTPLLDILKHCSLTENGNIKPATSVSTELLHRYFTPF